MSNEDLFQRNADLEHRLSGAPVEKQIHALVTSGRRNRHLIRLTFTGLALDLILSLVLGLQWYRTDDAQRNIAKTAQTAHDTCLASNKTRADQITLWNFVINLSTQDQKGKTKEELARQEVQTNQFKIFIRKTFAPRKCPPAPGR